MVYENSLKILLFLLTSNTFFLSIILFAQGILKAHYLWNTKQAYWWFKNG